jgi:hypothetical protein
VHRGEDGAGTGQAAMQVDTDSVLQGATLVATAGLEPEADTIGKKNCVWDSS